MRSELKKLLERAQLEKKDVQQEAVLQIAMLLERHSSAPDTLDFYKNIMDPDLLSITLDKTDQEEVIAELSALIMSEKMIPTMLWALGKTSLRASLPPVLIWLQKHGHEADADAIWQALVVLRNFLTLGSNDQIAPDVAKIIHDTDPISLLQILREIDNKGSPEAQNLTRQLIDHIERSL